MKELAERIECLLGWYTQRQVVVTGVDDDGRGFKGEYQAWRERNTVREASPAESTVQYFVRSKVLFQRLPKAKRRAAVENDWTRRRVKDSRFESLDLVLKSVGGLLTEGAACTKAKKAE